MMRRTMFVGTFVGYFLSTLSAAAQQPSATPSKPAAAVAEGTGKAELKDKTLSLDGIAMTVPDGWTREEAKTVPMGPIAVFKLTKADGEAEDATVRITYFPAMKGKDDMNIDRWIGQVKKADGSAHTRESVKITKVDQGEVKLTIVDLTGTVNNSMSGAGADASTAGTRMIAAIVDHPKGPHYVRATGSVKTMEKWQPAVDAFLKSAKVN